jgi:transcription elongation GreA/GreB family factor
VSEEEHVCVPVTNEAGEVIAHAQVSADIGDEGMRALAAVIAWAQKDMAEKDAADPEAAEERGRRQAAGIARIRERARRRGVSRD